MPVDLTLFTRLIPRANSGASNPSSAASAASLRTADMRMIIDDDPRPRSSRDTRHALTVAFVKPGRGACWNHAINSFSAMLYTRFCNRRGDAVQHERLQFLPLPNSSNRNQISHFGSF
jgi:hypothetical protein